MLIVFMMTVLLAVAIGLAWLIRLPRRPVAAPVRVQQSPGVRILMDRTELSQALVRATTFDREVARRTSQHIARYQAMDEPAASAARAPDRPGPDVGDTGGHPEPPGEPALAPADAVPSSAGPSPC